MQLTPEQKQLGKDNFNEAVGYSRRDWLKGLSAAADVAPGQEAVLRVRYRSRGLGDWTYAFSSSGVAQVRDFQLAMKTDFRRNDFPAGTLSPTGREPAGEGWDLSWRFASLVTGQRIGMDAPNRLNPGPLAARITFFAPVSLLFFIAVMVIVGAIRGQSLHPMHYFLVSTAFFAFHLLLAYLVDHVDIHAAFAISAATSLFLVISYLRLVAGSRFAPDPGGRRAIRVPRPLQLRVLLRGVYGAHRHRGGDRDPVRPDAAHRACPVGGRVRPRWGRVQKGLKTDSHTSNGMAKPSSGMARARSMSSIPMPRARSLAKGGAAVSRRPRSIQT